MPGQFSHQTFHLTYKMYRFLWNAVDWIYPPKCAGCNRLGYRWCADCQAQATRIGKPICVLCGEAQPTEGICGKCRASPPCYDALRAWGYFSGPLREAIHQFKYKRNLGLGEPFSILLEEVIKTENWKADLIFPVPLSTQRQNERGYNQSEVLARPLAMRLNIPCRNDTLIRNRDTRSQVGLNAKMRQENVRDAFSTHKDEVRGKNIIVIDDVATTGSTLNACSLALKLAGVNNVYCLTLARAGSPDDDLPQAT